MAADPAQPVNGTAFPVRRVVAGHDDCGRAVLVSDGAPAFTVTSPAGHGLSELLWFEAPPVDRNDGGEPPADLHGGFPADGAIACRLIRFPGYPPGTAVEDTWLRIPGDDPNRPGMHRSETLDLMVVVDGYITLGLDDGEHALGPGDAVVQRGTLHRWRVVGERPCTFLSVLLAPRGPAPTSRHSPELSHVASSPDRDEGAVRRLVTATFPDGTSGIALFGAPASQVQPSGPGGVALYDLWQTGGPVSDVAQGGDVTGPWSLEPAGGGVAFRRVDFAAGHDPGSAGFHSTHTIDVGIVLSGALELALPADPEASDPTTAVLSAGDVVIQRATPHRWCPVGSDPAVLVSVMIGLPTDRSSVPT